MLESAKPPSMAAKHRVTEPGTTKPSGRVRCDHRWETPLAGGNHTAMQSPVGNQETVPRSGA